MMSITARHLATCIRSISVRLGEASDELCRLDGQIGDGDHGITMALGFDAVVQRFVEEDLTQIKISDLFTLSAEHFLNAVGATTGPLYAAAFQRAAMFTIDKNKLTGNEALLVLAEMSDGIATLGKAQPGDKTMMDVWFLVAQHVRANNQIDIPLSRLIRDVREIATDGVAVTKTMVASKGRAARLGERSLGYADPGAASAIIIIECFCNFLEEFVD